MATAKLIGADDATPAGSLGANYIVIDRFQCAASGRCTEIRVKCTGSGNVKVAVYADSSGSPGSRLAKQDTGVACVSGWNTISLESALDIAIGTYYWLAFISDSTIGGYISQAGSGHQYSAQTYSGFTWPTTLPSLTAADQYTSLFAGWGILVLSPSSINQPVSYGSPKLILAIKPSSILQALAYGTPTVLMGALIIQPSSTVQVVAIGTPALRYPQTIAPPSIIVTITCGTPWVGIFGFVRPQSIIQLVAIGTPTILKYVWHVILDGQYATETPGVNRAYIIGRDQYGNPVYGTAITQSEVDLVGERLDFQPDPAIPTTAQAGDVASAVLSKMRLMGKRGVILIPPNCGQELFDVVQISDSGANQQAVSFRVVGMRFEYIPKQARYEHKLLLGAL
ncbi:MAG: hypothetical protein A2Z75_02385 [Chloroflexi bacterium RBG_13_50_10]|nr:MAG: hypothetical protein A2Z75_02385 [Chloroflexi bacterium RBG_13_50_10]